MQHINCIYYMASVWNMVSQRISQPVKVCEKYENNMEFVVFFICERRDARRVRAARYVACYDTNGLAKVEQISCFDCAILSLFGRCIANGFIGSKHWTCIGLLEWRRFFRTEFRLQVARMLSQRDKFIGHRQVRWKLFIQTRSVEHKNSKTKWHFHWLNSEKMPNFGKSSNF